MPASKQPKIVKIVTLDIQRRHVKSCSRHGTSLDCPSASKKKCPYRIFEVGINEFGKRQKIRKSLKTNDQQTAADELQKYRRNIETLNEPATESAITVEDAMSRFFTEEKGRGVSESTLKSFHKCLDRRRDPAKFSPTLLMYAEANKLKYLAQITPDHIKEW